MFPLTDALRQAQGQVLDSIGFAPHECSYRIPASRRHWRLRVYNGTGTRACVLIVAIATVWGLKRHYADASPDDLRWILAPTTWCVEAMTGVAFTATPGEGYFSRERLFLIAKSCAGINFMIAAFGMLMVAFAHRLDSARSAAGVLIASLTAGYAAAVLVNALRITIAMALAAHPIARSSFSADDIHRIEGITVYFAGLAGLYELTRRIDRVMTPAGRLS